MDRGESPKNRRDLDRVREYQLGRKMGKMDSLPGVSLTTNDLSP